MNLIRFSNSFYDTACIVALQAGAQSQSWGSYFHPAVQVVTIKESFMHVCSAVRFPVRDEAADYAVKLIQEALQNIQKTDK